MTLLLTLTLAGNGASAAGSDAAPLPPDYGAPAGDDQSSGRSLPSFPANQNKASQTVQENYGPNITVGSYGASDADGDQITLSLAGADAAKFATDDAFEFGGMLFFGLVLNATPDFEDPDDANEDGVYEVTIRATDDDGTGEFDVRVTVTNVDEAPEITGLATVDYAENGTAAVGSYSATDPEGASTSLTLGGTDAASFAFANGSLSFNSAPDYETKTSYSITFTATDQTKNTATLAVKVKVTNVIEAGEIGLTGDDELTIQENSSTLLLETYTAINPDGGAVTWSLEGADKDDFALASAATGHALSLKASPDYETQSSYAVTVKAVSGAKSVARPVTVTVTNVDEAPVFTAGPTTASFVEGSTGTVGTYTAVDPEGGAIFWSMEGTDQAGFHLMEGIVPNSDRTARLDFSNPQDLNPKSSYSVTVKVADDSGNSSTRDVTVNIVQPDSPPTITGGPTAVTFAENLAGPVGRYTATDPDDDAIAWSVEGADAGKFNISAAGALRFNVVLDYDNPGDADQNNVYQVTVKATANGVSATRSVAVTVTDGNGRPYFLPLQRVDSLTTLENYGPVITFARSYAVGDHDGDAITLSKSGADAAKFTLQYGYAYSGVSYYTLKLNATPDYEEPDDANTDGVYEVTLRATDDDGSTDLDIKVTVQDVDEAPVITGLADPSFAENGTGTVASYSASDPEGADVTLTLGGTDAASFTIPSGALSFNSAPDYETKTSYSITITAEDQTENTATLAVKVKITNVVEPGEVTLTGSDDLSIGENSSNLLLETYTAGVQGDAQAQITWTLEGTDKDDFTLAAGTLSLNASPDYETKSSYAVMVKAASGGKSTARNVAVSVTNVDEAPVITSGPTTASFPEGDTTGTVGIYTAVDPEGEEIVWSNEGDTDPFEFIQPDDANGNPVPGTVRLDFNMPTDFETTSSYSVTMKATEYVAGGKSATRSVTVSITNVDEAPTITSGPTAPSFAENGNGTVATYAATDPENDAIAWTVEGADAGKFNISASGALSFKAAPDFESPGDADTNNKYQVTVKATANGRNATRNVTVTVTDVADTAVPGKVTVITATATDQNTVSLSWTAPSGGATVTGYKIMRRAVASESSFQTLSADTGNTNTTWTDRNLSPHTRYAYRVYALGANGAGPVSTLAAVRTPRSIPGKVTVIAATATAHNTVSLTWTVPSDGATVTGYKIMRRAVASQSSFQTLSANTGNTSVSYSDTGLSARTKYAYRVQALGANGAGKISSLATVVTPAEAAPGQVTGLSASATAHDTVSLSWTAPSDGGTVTGYQILRRDLANENSPQVLVSNTGGTGVTYTDSTATALTRYIYRVKALGRHAQGKVSDAAQVTTPRATLPGRATGLTATTTEEGTVSLSWTAPGDGGTVTGYKVWRRVMDGSQSSMQVVASDTGNANVTWTDSNVSAGKSYTYRVQALGAHGEGRVSAPATVSVPE